ncbi:hypothetical protein BX070DRAFT_224687 [Coemansia spiralis]|nr:hypothetical protein BX070DRAFT_224687 [Coemansia spiralis]
MEHQHGSPKKDNAQAQTSSLDTAYSGATAAQQTNSTSANDGSAQVPYAYENAQTPQVLARHQKYMLPDSQYQQNGQATQGQEGHQQRQPYWHSQEYIPQAQYNPFAQQSYNPYHYQQQQIQGQQPQIVAYDDPATWQQTIHQPYCTQSTTPFSQPYPGNQQGYYSQTNICPSEYNHHMRYHGTVAHHTNSPSSLASSLSTPPTSSANKMRPKNYNTCSEPHRDIMDYLEPRSFLGCLKDSIRQVTIPDILPLATLAAATFLHHHKHWSTGKVVPYKQPKWMKYVKNMRYAYNTYGFLKSNSLLGLGARGLKTVATRDISSTSRELNSKSSLPLPASGNQTHNWDTSRALHANESEDIPVAMDNILNSLFSTQTTGAAREVHGYKSAARGQPDVLAEFNDSYAVQRADAEHYFYYIYHNNMDLRYASAQAIGGAAAIKALQGENELRNMVFSDPLAPADLQHDQMIMGIAMSEVNSLLENKMRVCTPSHDETVEHIGKIALATIVKIKLDEEKEQSVRNSMQWNNGTRSMRNDRCTKSHQHAPMRRPRYDYTF